MRFLEEKMYIYDYITKNETIIEQIVIQETNKTFIIGVIYSFLFILLLIGLYIVHKVVKDEDYRGIAYIMLVLFISMLFILTLASWYSYFMWIRSPKIQAFNYIINNL